MRAAGLRLVTLSLAGAMLAACGGTAPSPTPDASDPPDAVVKLRVTTVQALPPNTTFPWLPLVLITLDGRVISGGPVPAIFPGPLVNPLVERQLSAAGWARVVDAARAAGLLSGIADLTGGALPPGSEATRVEIVADGKVHVITGDASRQFNCITTPCVPPPGTPEAFSTFITGLIDLATTVGAANLGEAHMYVPSGFGVIVGSAPDDQGLAQQPIGWPLEGGFAAFGKPLADGSGGRCGLITDDDLALIRGPFGAATQITRWRDPVDGSFHGLVVRPLLPGDGDPCQGLV